MHVAFRIHEDCVFNVYITECFFCIASKRNYSNALQGVVDSVFWLLDRQASPGSDINRA